MPFEAAIFTAGLAAVNFGVHSAQTVFEYRQVPVYLQTALYTIEAIKTDIVQAKKRRISLSKELDDDQLAEYDRSIDVVEKVLSSYEKAVEYARQKQEGNNGKVGKRARGMWIIRDSKSEETARSFLTIHHHRMLQWTVRAPSLKHDSRWRDGEQCPVSGMPSQYTAQLEMTKISTLDQQEKDEERLETARFLSIERHHLPQETEYFAEPRQEQRAQRSIQSDYSFDEDQYLRSRSIDYREPTSPRLTHLHRPVERISTRSTISLPVRSSTPLDSVDSHSLGHSTSSPQIDASSISPSPLRRSPAQSGSRRHSSLRTNSISQTEPISEVSSVFKSDIRQMSPQPPIAPREMPPPPYTAFLPTRNSVQLEDNNKGANSKSSSVTRSAPTHTNKPDGIQSPGWQTYFDMPSAYYCHPTRLSDPLARRSTTESVNANSFEKRNVKS